MYLLPYLLLNRWQKKLTLSKKKNLYYYFFSTPSTLSLYPLPSPIPKKISPSLPPKRSKCGQAIAGQVCI